MKDQGNQPLISIVVPVYKVEKYLRKCVESILAQTYTKIEVILVDDGSADNSPAICDEYACKDSRVKVIHKKNSGVSDARNEGLNVARGDYIGFVDSDDWIEPRMYEVLLDKIRSSDADVAVCDYAMRNIVDDNVKYAMPGELKDKCLNKTELIREAMQPYGGFFAVVWNKLYRKSVLKDIRFPSGKHVEDEFILHHVIIASEKTVCISDVLYNYLLRDDSFMHQKFSAGYMDYGYALLDRYALTKKLGCHQWREHTVIRLSFELEKWAAHRQESREISDKYNDLRKKARFLLFEPAAWKGYSWRGKTLEKISLLFPLIGDMLRRTSRGE